MEIMSFYLIVKFTVLKALRKSTLTWYHTALQHPDIQQTERTMRSYLLWPQISKDAEKQIKAVINNKVFKYLAPNKS